MITVSGTQIAVKKPVWSIRIARESESGSGQLMIWWAMTPVIAPARKLWSVMTAVKILGCLPLLDEM